MRQISHGPLVFLLLFLIILSIHTSAVTSRSLQPVPKQGGLKFNEGLRQAGQDADVLADEQPWDLMGIEECKEGNEECQNGRMMYEAHLDYIYTQHRRKP
ncbi:hypothetical protein Cni_G10334 [Canna indica]|uniref:Phytosulfokine n=1 Tax=Canna indica TaxID=4628 RepID=A0AAQ3K471_9LILI|nr:hypothetical protein Cni_G10334 [Canna indica]